jgi:hypothetical protein
MEPFVAPTFLETESEFRRQSNHVVNNTPLMNLNGRENGSF